MYNKLIKNQKKLKDKLESTHLVKLIQDRLTHQGGKYTSEQAVDMIALQDDFSKKREELKIESLKKNLELFN